MNGLIVFSYSTLKSIDDVYEFYNHLFHYKQSREVIHQYVEKFRLFGKIDPSTYYTYFIGEAIVRELNQITGDTWKLYVGNKHTTPFVDEATKQAIEDGCTKLFTLSFSPLHSKTGYISYLQKVKKVVDNVSPNIKVTSLGDYWKDPQYIQLLAKRLKNTYEYVSNEHKENNKVKIIFTSHSLPGTESSNKDFIQQYNQLGKQILSEAKLNKVPYRFAYRSVGPDSQKWLRPDICDVLKEEKDEGIKTVVLFELLSMIENIEAALELGEEAKQVATHLGITFYQVPYINDSYDFVQFFIEKIRTVSQKLNRNS